MTEVSVVAGVPDDFRALCWQTFFVSRGRGVSLASHFPWLDESGVVSVLARNQVGATIGGLVLRPFAFSDAHATGVVGLVGLVCVEPTHRGLGVATELLTACSDFAAQRQLTGLMLWAKRPTVYARCGFAVNDPWCYGTVEPPNPAHASASDIGGLSAAGFRSAPDLPVPPFARDCLEYRDHALRLLVWITNENELVVAEASGEPDELADFLIRVLPTRWRLNALQNDPLIDALSRRGVIVSMQANQTQMWKALSVGPDAQPVRPPLVLPTQRI